MATKDNSVTPIRMLENIQVNSLGKIKEDDKDRLTTPILPPIYREKKSI